MNLLLRSSGIHILTLYFSCTLLIEIASGFSVRQTKQCESIDQHGKLVPGQCVEFILCPRLLEFAKSPRKTVQDYRLLKQLTCGFYKDRPWVCCPEKDIYRPPSRDDDHSEIPLAFPDEGSDKRKDRESQGYGSPNVPFSGSKGTINLIPRLEDCGEPRSQMLTTTRIFGGSESEPGEFPYMALLYRIDTTTDEEEYYCSGTIINEYYILTAAHCILTNQDSGNQLAYVQVGITDVTERCHQKTQRECASDRRYEVKDTVVHPKYIYGSRDRSHDIALIRVAKPMDFDEKYIKPVCLPFAKTYGIPEESLLDVNRDQSGKNPVIGHGFVTGWGRYNNSGSQSSTTLKSAILPILTKNECQHRYGHQVKISEKLQLCAGGELGKDTCVGDSGGPLLVPFEPEISDSNSQQKHNSMERFRGKMFQTGIISFGPALCGISGKPSVSTNVLGYVDWILDSMYL